MSEHSFFLPSQIPATTQSPSLARHDCSYKQDPVRASGVPTVPLYANFGLSCYTQTIDRRASDMLRLQRVYIIPWHSGPVVKIHAAKQPHVQHKHVGRSFHRRGHFCWQNAIAALGVLAVADVIIIAWQMGSFTRQICTQCKSTVLTQSNSHALCILRKELKKRKQEPFTGTAAQHH